MENVYLNLSIFTVFLKNRNFISKIRISKVTDYAALSDCTFYFITVVAEIPSFLNASTFDFTLLDGDPYTIQCQSTPTRPAAIITWKIRNNDITNTSTNTREVTEDGGLMSVISTLSLYAQRSYHQSEIICDSKIIRQSNTPETRKTLIIWCK